MTDANLDEQNDPKAETPLYGVGPVTIRELGLVVIWLIAFIVSFFSLFAVDRYAGLDGATVIPGFSVWTIGVEWILTIGLPTAAVFLVILRRFSPQGIRRVGSLGIDQFASVAFSVSAAVWFTLLWQDIANGVARGGLAYSWVVWVEFFLMLAGVVLTVLAPFIPPFADDFRGRPEASAHRNARPVRAVTPRPRPEPVAQPAPAAPAPQPSFDTGETATFGELGIDAASSPASTEPDDAWSPPYARRGAGEPETDDASAQAPVAAASPFWALAPVEREVHDELGAPIFTVGPTAWALVIEDRGTVYVIQHEDGRIGYLHDVTGIRRG